MRRFVEGTDRVQSTLFPECLEDWIGEDNPVRVIDVFVDELDLAGLGFNGVEPEVTGRPSYHPSVLLKLYIYGLTEVMSARSSSTRHLGFSKRPARFSSSSSRNMAPILIRSLFSASVFGLTDESKCNLINVLE